jgi:hypothetical protein
LKVQVIALSKFLNKLLNEGFVKGDATDILEIFFLATLYELRLKEHKLVVAAPEFQILAHQIGHVCSKPDLHLFWDCANRVVINKQVFLHGCLYLGRA